MRKRTKLRLAVLGGMMAGVLAGGLILDALEAVARWMLMNWFLLDEGHAAAQAPAMSGVLIAALFFVGVCIYNPWEETSHRCGPASQEPCGAPLNRGAKNQRKKRAG